MNEYGKSGLYVAGAILMVVLAKVTEESGERHEFFNDEGQPLFADFKEPDQAASLEVLEFDQAAKEVKPFNVARDDKGVWTIPSHSNYPADAKTRMAKAASMLIGLRKDRVISDEPDDHAQFGVVDPLDESAKSEGRGTRVTLKDKAGTALADLVIGMEVDGKSDMRYVRLPGKNRVYSSKLGAELSTRFEDWIERDLLKTSSWDLGKVVFDNYSVDEQRGAIVPGEKFALHKDDQQKWVLDGLATSEETNEDKAREITDALTQLKIVGVRPKPPGITAALKTATGFDRMAIQQHLARKGYFVDQDGNLVSNEGDLIADSKKGVVYTLKFGEIVYGTGEAVSAGRDEDLAAQPKPGETGPQPAEGSHRYLMITAEFDEQLLQKPGMPRLTDDQLQKRKDARARIEAIVKAIDAYKTAHEGKLPAALTALTEGEKPPLEKLEQDPWGSDYVLAVEGEAFTVKSLGEDRAPGGEGAAADIANDKLAFEDELGRAAADWKAYDQKVTDGKKAADDLTKRFGPWYYVIDAASFAKLKPARKDLVKEKAAEPPKTGDGEADKDGGK